MSSSLLEAAFAHLVWATLRVIDACLYLSAEGLETSVLGTRGPMLETLRHVVAGDTEYLFILTAIVHSTSTLRTCRSPRLASSWSAMALDGPSSSPGRSTRMPWCERSTRPTGKSGWLLSDSGSRRPCTTAPTIAVRSARLSRRSVWSRRRSTSGTSDWIRAGSWRRCRTRSASRWRWGAFMAKRGEIGGSTGLLDLSPFSPRGGEGNTVGTPTPRVRACGSMPGAGVVSPECSAASMERPTGDRSPRPRGSV